MTRKSKKQAETQNENFEMPDQTSSEAVVVVGDGWAALATVGFLVQRLAQSAGPSAEDESRPSSAKRLIWVNGTGSRIFSALPSLEAGECAENWKRLAEGFGIETGPVVTGSFVREFRNKAFREPAWTHAPTPDDRHEVIREMLWPPEQKLAPVFEARMDLSVNEIEQRVRELLTEPEGAPEGKKSESIASSSWHSYFRRIEGVPVASIKIEEGRVRAVLLASGEEIVCSEVIYADRWSTLPRIQGLPKAMGFLQGREPASVLQAAFVHAHPVGADVREGFFGTLHKESGEEFERHVWGHFSADGTRSFWTLYIDGEEVEDNHQIAKKLRRLKNALEKMFTGSSWLPEGVTEFMANVRSEQVRFQEAALFSTGDEPSQPVQLPSVSGIWFVTDAYGPSSALKQVGAVIGLSEESVSSGPNTQEESVNPENPVSQ